MRPIADGFRPFGAAWWKSLGEAVVLEVKTQAEKGVGAGVRFKPYSPGYAERKGGDKFRRQSSTQTSPPNLELTGDMMRDLKVLDVAADNATVGWAVYGERVRHNAAAGRPLSSPGAPFATGALRLIDRRVKAMIREQLNGTRGVKVIRVGK